MKERPILFNAEMVKAILSGRKTQTRRIIKLDHERGFQNPVVRGRAGEVSSVEFGLSHMLCPLGQPGDQLWVREAFATGLCTKTTTAYKATHKAEDLEEGWLEKIKWRPSIHMPRWASRINLLITGVRVERLNDISQEDAKSEGCCYGRGGGVPDLAVSPADHFPTLWESVYGIKSWAANPWVWVIEFERVAPAGEKP